MSPSRSTSSDLHVVFGDIGRQAADELAGEYRSTLTRPPDDMWSAFADHADAAALMAGDRLIGNAALDTEGALHRFFMRSGFEHLSTSMLGELRGTRPVRSMIVSTGDPGALSTLLPVGRDPAPVALLYSHEAEPDGGVLDAVRTATDADHERASAFVPAATGDPAGFIRPYLAERIADGELFIHEADDEILAVGERRVDRRSVGYAHLGMIVGREHRGRGLGRSMMNSLVAMCGREQLTPLCSTEPDNVAAQRVIRRAGFRGRHTVFRLTMTTRDVSTSPNLTRSRQGHLR